MRAQNVYLLLRYILTTQRNYLRFLEPTELPLDKDAKVETTPVVNQQSIYHHRGNFTIHQVLAVLDQDAMEEQQF